MSCCITIRVKSEKTTVLCQRYKITGAGVTGQWGGYKYTECNGDIVMAQIGGGASEYVCVKQGTTPEFVNGEISITFEAETLCNSENVESVDDGYLDLADGFDLRVTKVLTELTEFNKLKFDYSLGFSLPATPNNLNLLRKFNEPDLLDNHYKEIPIEIQNGAYFLPESSLYVQSIKGDSIDVEISLSKNHWGRLASNLKLSEITHNTVTWNRSLIDDVIQNQYPYDYTNLDHTDDSNLGIYFPLADYGRVLHYENSSTNNAAGVIMPIEYFRPYYYVTSILQRGFCSMGYTFTSPLFLSEFGSKLICYLLDSNLGLLENEGTKGFGTLRLNASLTQNWQYGAYTTYARMFHFNDIQGNQFGSWDSSRDMFFASGEVNIIGRIRFKRKRFVNATKIRVRVGQVIESPSGELYMDKTYSEQTFEDIERTECTEWSFDVKNVSCTTTQGLGVMITNEVGHGVSDALDLCYGSFMNIEGVRSYLQENEDYSLNKMIGDYTFIDFIKGLVDVFNLKFKTNVSNRSVEMYIPFDKEFGEQEKIEGFYIEETIEDITSLLACETAEIVSPNDKLPRYLSFRYRDTKNKYLDQYSLKNPLWSKDVDLGDKYKDDKVEIKNKFFAPAIFDKGMLRFNGQTEHTFNILPKILICFGNVVHDYSSANTLEVTYYEYSGTPTELLPTSAMLMPYKIGDTHNDLNSDVFLMSSNLVFDVNSEVTNIEINRKLYDLVWHRYVIEKYNNTTISYLINLTNNKFLESDFRNLYKIRFNGRDIVARMTLIKDFRFCDDLFTPIEFQPLKMSSDLCGLLPENNGEGGGGNMLCNNFPEIFIDQSGTCQVFTLGGLNNAPIQSVTFYYRSDTVWLLMSNISTVSAQLCNMQDEYYIKAVVTYGEVNGVQCDDIETIEQLVTPCDDKYLDGYECTAAVFPNGDTVGWLLIWTTTPDPITIVSAEVSIDGASPIPFDLTQYDDRLLSDPVEGNTFDFEVVLKMGDCQEITINSSCIAEDSIVGYYGKDCSQNEIGLTCQQTTNGCYTFIKSGVFLSSNYDEYVRYRISSDGVNWGEWQLWDGSDVCAEHVQAKYYVHFCNDICPFLCSEVTECGGCSTPFEVGTINNAAVCNNGTI